MPTKILSPKQAALHTLPLKDKKNQQKTKSLHHMVFCNATLLLIKPDITGSIYIKF